MRAEEMRKITDQAQLENANKFWCEFKDILFDGLKRQAECRCDGLTLGERDELSKTKQGASWISYKPLRDKVKKELEELGYKFSFSDAQQGATVSITW